MPPIRRSQRCCRKPAMSPTGNESFGDDHDLHARQSQDDDHNSHTDQSNDIQAKRRKVSIDPSLSPKSKTLVGLQHRTMRIAAYKELMMVRAAAGGKVVHNDLQMIVDDYQTRGHNVQRWHLKHQITLGKQGKEMKMFGNNKPAYQIQLKNSKSTGNISPLTMSQPSTTTTPNSISDTDHSISKPDHVQVIDVDEEILDDEPIEKILETEFAKKFDDETEILTASEHPAVDSTNVPSKKAKLDYESRLEKAKCVVAAQYLQEKIKAKEANKKVAPTFLKFLIKNASVDYSVMQSDFNPHTIRSRVRSKNPSGIASHKLPPLRDIEGFICEMIIAMSKMTRSLTKWEIMELTDDIIRGTIHAERYIAWANRRGKTKTIYDESFVGEKWYRHFMDRFSDKLKRSRVRILDEKRVNWCTFENFENMYECIYKNMVECGVAIKLDKLTIIL
jgi:hypothetical protein